MGYIKLSYIMDNLMEHPLLEDLTLDRVIKYAIEFIQIVGMPDNFEESLANIEINKYKGKLPCDVYNIIQVRDENGVCFRYSTDSFHYSHNINIETDLTYKTKGNYIYTSIENGTIEIVYHKLPVDEDGIPMLFDIAEYLRAFELYVKKKCFTILFDQNKISAQVLQNTQQEYAWAVGQAQSSLIRPTIDVMESITNSLTTLLQRTTQHDVGFISNGMKQHLKLH